MSLNYFFSANKLVDMLEVYGMENIQVSPCSFTTFCKYFSFNTSKLLSHFRNSKKVPSRIVSATKPKKLTWDQKLKLQNHPPTPIKEPSQSFVRLFFVFITSLLLAALTWFTITYWNSKILNFPPHVNELLSFNVKLVWNEVFVIVILGEIFWELYWRSIEPGYSIINGVADGIMLLLMVSLLAISLTLYFWLPSLATVYLIQYLKGSQLSSFFV